MPELRDTGVRNVVCGKNVVIYQPANLYDCTLGDNVFVGPFVEIQGNTRIGAESKIQSHTFICEYVTIGRRCFIGHGVMFANDLFRDGKPNADRAKLLSEISRYASGKCDQRVVKTWINESAAMHDLSLIHI